MESSPVHVIDHTRGELVSSDSIDLHHVQYGGINPASEVGLMLCRGDENTNDHGMNRVSIESKRERER